METIWSVVYYDSTIIDFADSNLQQAVEVESISLLDI